MEAVAPELPQEEMMSGGSLDYVYGKLEDAIPTIASYGRDHKLPHVEAFAKHLDLVKEALHDIEWTMSGDYGQDGADDSIAKVLGPMAGTRTLEVILEDLRESAAKIEALVANRVQKDVKKP